MRRILLLAGAWCLVGLPIAAQEKGTLELGGFGRFTKYDGSFHIDRPSRNAYGGGGRIGYFFSPKFSLEADGSYNASDQNFFTGYQSTPVRYWPFHLRGLFNTPLGSGFSFLVGGGVVVNHYGKSNATPPIPTINGQDFGVGALVGLRYRIFRWLALRADGTLDFMPSPRNGKDEITSQGIVGTVPSKNTHLGAQLGLSLFPAGGKCTKRLDAIDLQPNTAALAPGQSQQFTTTGRLCDGSSTAPQVTYSASGGTITPGGLFSSTTSGSFQVVAKTLNGKLSDTSTVTVSAPPPPPPPPAPRLTRIDLQPDRADLKLKESATFTVTGAWSDGNSRAMRPDECTLSAEGNPTASEWSYTWTRSGNYTVTANCQGMSDQSAVTVTGLVLTLRALFDPNIYSQARRIEMLSLDSVANVMKADPSIKVTADGHTDWRNSVRYNAWLSEGRARYVQRELAKRGVQAARVIIRGWGECRPVTDNSTEEGMQQNRRTELHQVESEPVEPANANCKESGPPGASKIGRKGE